MSAHEGSALARGATREYELLREIQYIAGAQGHTFHPTPPVPQLRRPKTLLEQPMSGTSMCLT